VIDDLLVTVDDLRAASMCVRGAKQWFRLHKLDFASFLAIGLPASTLAALNDEMADRAIAMAKKRVDGED
jgi:hypothetical protein